jgi:hypothetical protein
MAWELRRGKNKITTKKTTADGYKESYRKEVEKGSKFDITQGVYGDIVKNYNKTLLKYMLDRGRTIILPCKLGRLEFYRHHMNYLDKKSLPIDWGATNKLKKIVYCLNEHTNGIRYKIVWKSNYLKNGSLYMFRVKREWLRYLAKKLKAGELIY